MPNHSDKIETQKFKLKSVNKQKISKERCVYKLRNKERSISEELSVIKAEVDILTEQLQASKDQIAQTRHQISMIEICSASEKSKLDMHVINLNKHQEGFQRIFDTDRILFELRNKELKQKEAEEEELLKQKEKEIAEVYENEAMKIAIIEDECSTIERECAVLKKRNNAIMLKLRRKLVETENSRRLLMNQGALSGQVSNIDEYN